MRDIERMVLEPLEKMMEKVEVIAADPIKAAFEDDNRIVAADLKAKMEDELDRHFERFCCCFYKLITIDKTELPEVK